MTPNPVRWFEIYVQDMQRAQHFYETVFETKLQPLGSGDLEILGFPQEMKTVGCAGALVRAPGVPSGGTGTVVYFSSEDCAVESARVAAAGGKLHREKLSIGQYGFIALAYDTEGNLIGIHSLR